MATKYPGMAISMIHTVESRLLRSFSMVLRPMVEATASLTTVVFMRLLRASKEGQGVCVCV
jgi:hypothetical protein